MTEKYRIHNILFSIFCILVLLLSFAVGFVANPFFLDTLTSRIGFLPNMLHSSTVNPAYYIPEYKAKHDVEILFVYIGSHSCKFSNDEDLPSLIEQAKLITQDLAREHKYEMSTLGAAIDWSVENGLRHLSKFGLFDEIISGRKWQNTAARLFIYENIPGAAATPQLVLVKRKFAPSSFGRQIVEEKLLVRKVGKDEIEDWLSIGAPIPGFTSDISVGQ